MLHHTGRLPLIVIMVAYMHCKLFKHALLHAVMFKPGLMETVDLAERPVAGRYQGFGQINASTAVYAPAAFML